MQRIPKQLIGLVCAYAVSAAAFGAQDAQGEQKPVPHIPPQMEDVKTDWFSPEKPAGAVSAPAPQETSPAPGAQAQNRVAEDLRALRGGRSLIDNDRLYFDEPGDGAIWVRGKNYKASFGSAGATYVPFFGSEAPQNYPVRLSLESVTVGGEALTLTTAAPVRDGERISFDHGSVTEVYDVALESIEQKFVLDSLPRAGELVLFVNVDSSLEKSSSDGKLVFDGEHGKVEYTRAIAFDADGTSLQLATTPTASGIVIRVPEEYLAQASLPLVIDPVLTSVPVNVSDSDDFNSDVAYDTQNDLYLIVFERAFSAADHDIYSVFYDPATGLLQDGAYIDFTTDTWRDPQVANNYVAMNFLCVATEGADGSREVVGRIRHADLFGAVLTQFPISSGSGEKFDPDVGGDPVELGPTYFCVVWQREFDPMDHDIHAQLVQSDSALHGSSIWIDNTAFTLDTQPSISKSNGPPPFGTQRWNIVWQREFTPTDHDIRSAQLSWDGVIQTPSFSADFNPQNDTSPVVSPPLDNGPDERPYMIAYERENGALHGKLMQADQTMQDLDLNQINGDLPANSYQNPEIDAAGRQITLVYKEVIGVNLVFTKVRATSMKWLGFSLFELISRTEVSSASLPGAPHVALEGGGSAEGMISWQTGIPIGNRDIHGAIYDHGSPANDDCASSEVVVGLGSFPFSNVGATSDTSITASCGSIYRDVWFEWTAPASGEFAVRTCGSATDTKIAAYAGSGCPAAASIACEDDVCGLASQISFNAIGGETFTIRIGLWSTSSNQVSETFDIVMISDGNDPGVSYCTSSPNSVSVAGCNITASGSTSISANDLVLSAGPTPAGQPGIFYYGENAIQVPFGNGTRCVGGQTYRLYPFTHPVGFTATHSVDMNSSPNVGVLVPGVTYYFQWWHRDPAGAGAGFNLSDGLELSFLP